jgi:hypothetical protein
VGGGLLAKITGALGIGGGQAPQGVIPPDGITPPQTKVDEQKALQFVQDRWNDLKNSYVVIHQSIWQSLLFYANQSWIDWDDARKVWQPQQPTDEWVPRPRINRFSPTIDAVTANFARIPEVEAIPTPDDDPTATMVADVCTRLSQWIVTKEGLKVQTGQKNDRIGMAAQLFVLAGAVFTRIGVKNNQKMVDKMAPQQTSAWSCATCDTYQQMDVGEQPPQVCPACGNPVNVEQSEKIAPVLDAMGNPTQEPQDEYELCLGIGNSLYAFPRPGATCIEDSPYLLWAERHPTDEIFFRHGFEAQPDAIWPDGYSVTYEHALNFWYTGYSNTAIQVKDSCMELEMYVAPGKVKDFPGGFYQAVANDQPMQTEDWEFPEHPVTMGGYLVLPTLFFPRSVAFDLVEIQRELNAYESIIKLHGMVAAVDPIVIDANTIVTDITGRSDKVIKWRATGPQSQPPFRLESGHLDDGIYKQRESLHAEFQNISMAVNAVRGQQEGAITASSAIQQLRAQAETMFNKPVANWNNLWRETIRKYVKFIQRYYSFQQIAKIVGANSEEEVRLFKGADLDNMVEWVSTTSGLPRTRDERRQELMALWDKGALDLSQPEVRQKIAELFGETGMMKSFKKDATNARLENQAFSQGATDIHPMPLVEDMETHLYFHKDQAKSPDFKKWPPQAQQALYQHIIETDGELTKQKIQEGQMAILAKVGQRPSVAPEPEEAQQMLGQKNSQGQSRSLSKTTPVAPGGGQ